MASPRKCRAGRQAPRGRGPPIHNRSSNSDQASEDSQPPANPPQANLPPGNPPVNNPENNLNIRLLNTKNYTNIDMHQIFLVVYYNMYNYFLNFSIFYFSLDIFYKCDLIALVVSLMTSYFLFDSSVLFSSISLSFSMLCMVYVLWISFFSFITPFSIQCTSL